jgi:hypothetical protein
MSFHRYAAPAFAAAVLSASPMLAQVTTVLQPDEASSKDVFTYEFENPGLFGVSTPPNTTNLDTETLAVENPMSPLGILLASSKSDTSTSSDPDSAHSSRTWIEFDVSGIATSGAEVLSATLNLYVIDGEDLVASILGQPAFGNPSPASPLPTGVYLPDGAWGEQTITWDNEPDELSLLSTINLTGVEQWATWDVTAAVKAWVDGSPNNGLFIEQEEVVASATALTNVAAALYASSAFADAGLRPFLSITVVPEPTSLALTSLLTLGGVCLRRR